MSVECQVYVFCSGCGQTLDYDEHGVNAADVRDKAREFYGWHVALKGGRDICARCWDRGTR